ncbi:tetratricopeptide repeat protein [Plasticicumulans lactativorans]|uniref:Tetratricopeptide repeat protein n=1 Tax=Plasticicumulans lactativorans TaxID=1133106 RepID=A0A4R2L3M7_9GAMM|nr:tetratricopeptide repeat protein [Plasticicumulans lactativorans]TCO80312.1 tetratricopeptide repeat protein [Plasticicumulans lactativorans]
MTVATCAVLKKLDAEVRALVAAGAWTEVAATLKSVPADAQVPVSLAANAYKAHMALGQEVVAEEWLDRALILAPANPGFCRNKGMLHQKRQEWNQAIECYRKAVALRPELAAYHGALAVALFQRGDYREAVTEFRIALQTDAGQRGWWLRLARSLVLLNELSEAAEAYSRALVLQEDFAVRSAHAEVLRQIQSGSRVASSAYYDAVFAESKKYACPAESSEYAPVWQRIVDALGKRDTRCVIDLGCGPGQFAEFIAAHLPTISYTGLDFSDVAVSRARQRCPQYLFERCELPVADFSELPRFDAVVCTEVLEHVEHDREIFASLPVGVYIIASVPNFDAFGHIRFFRNADEVRGRYGSLVDELEIERISLAGSSVLWLMKGTRSAQDAGDDGFMADR